MKHTGAQDVCISSNLKTKIFFLTKQDTLRENFAYDTSPYLSNVGNKPFTILLSLFNSQ
jgi:hypothetical protein